MNGNEEEGITKAYQTRGSLNSICRSVEVWHEILYYSMPFTDLKQRKRSVPVSNR